MLLAISLAVVFILIVALLYPLNQSASETRNTAADLYINSFAGVINTVNSLDPSDGECISENKCITDATLEYRYENIPENCTIYVGEKTDTVSVVFGEEELSSASVGVFGNIVGSNSIKCDDIQAVIIYNDGEKISIEGAE